MSRCQSGQALSRRPSGLPDGQHLTVAGCLCFADHPQSWLPEAFVRVLRYRGSERGSGARQQLASDQRFEGPIPRVLTDARREIAELGRPGGRSAPTGGW